MNAQLSERLAFPAFSKRERQIVLARQAVEVLRDWVETADQDRFSVKPGKVIPEVVKKVNDILDEEIRQASSAHSKIFFGTRQTLTPQEQLFLDVRSAMIVLRRFEWIGQREPNGISLTTQRGYTLRYTLNKGGKSIRVAATTTHDNKPVEAFANAYGMVCESKQSCPTKGSPKALREKIQYPMRALTSWTETMIG